MIQILRLSHLDSFGRAKEPHRNIFPSETFSDIRQHQEPERFAERGIYLHDSRDASFGCIAGRRGVVLVTFSTFFWGVEN